MKRSIHRSSSGFTIVELLIVVIVIGILASLLFVSFTGLNQRAIVASIKTDLSTAAKQLKLFSIENGSYPATISTDCATSPDTTTNKCITSSPGNDYTIYPYTSTASTFTLFEANGDLVYRVTESSAPGQVAPLTAITSITGTAQEDSVLTAGVLSPTGATATYQWQSAATSDGTYTEISGATSVTYTATSADIGRFIRVVATGSNTYYSTVTSGATTAVTINPWITGLASTTMSGKFVYYRDVNSSDPPDLSNTPRWSGGSSACASPQCTTTVYPAPDSIHASSKVLSDPIANGAVSFSGYPAQASCKTLGGRLPTIAELLAVSAGKASYGNNFSGTNYWTATEYSANYAYNVYFPSSVESITGKTNGNYVRCVKG